MISLDFHADSWKDGISFLIYNMELKNLTLCLEGSLRRYLKVPTTGNGTGYQQSATACSIDYIHE